MVVVLLFFLKVVAREIVFMAHFSVSPESLTFSEGARMSLSYSAGKTNSAIFSRRSGKRLSSARGF